MLSACRVSFCGSMLDGVALHCLLRCESFLEECEGWILAPHVCPRLRPYPDDLWRVIRIRGGGKMGFVQVKYVFVV